MNLEYYNYDKGNFLGLEERLVRNSGNVTAPDSNYHSFYGDAFTFLGINPDERIRLSKLGLEDKRRELLLQLPSYKSEAAADEAVSGFVFNYKIGEDGRLYTSGVFEPMFLAINQFDLRERNGLPTRAFEIVTDLVLNNRNKVVLSYSPRGPAAFDKDPNNPYSKINGGDGYPNGQLFLYVGNEGGVDMLAVKISNEKALKQFMKKTFELAQRTKSEKEKIEVYHLNPVVSDFTLSEFLDYGWKNELAYEGKYETSYLDDVILEIRDRFSNRDSSIYGEQAISNWRRMARVEGVIRKEEITEEDIRGLYLGEIYDYGLERGERSVVLRGCVTNSVVNISGFRELLEGGRKNEFSSSGDLVYFGIGKKHKRWDYHFGTCVVCKSEGEVGPCEICKGCEKRFERGQIN